MDANAGHFSPEMLQGQMMFQQMPGMSSPGQMGQMPFGNMEQLQSQVAAHGNQMGNQAQGHAHPGYAMQGHAMGMQGMGQGMPQGMQQGMPQGMPQGMQQQMAQQMGQGMQVPQGMSPGMSQDGTMVPFSMDSQVAQTAAAHSQMMQQHGGGHCQGSPCGGCGAGAAAGACGHGGCGGYVFQPMHQMMMPQNMVQNQMAMTGAPQASNGQGGQQFHPNMQFVMVPGGGQMQPGMAGMQGVQGQMAQMQGMQGQMAQLQGHTADGHGNQPGQGQSGDGQHGQEASGDGNAKGGTGRTAAGRRNTQPKQGASWQGNRPGRPDMRASDSEVPAVPGEQGKGNQQTAQGAQDGQKGMRQPKNPWADIQDSGGLDQEIQQMWAMPSTENQQKSGFGKGKGKKDGKADSKAGDDGGKGGKDMPQQKWVEVQKNNVGKGQNRSMRQDQWQPILDSTGSFVLSSFHAGRSSEVVDFFKSFVMSHSILSR